MALLKPRPALWSLGILAAVMIALRLAAVFTAFDALSYGDELDLGTIALEMLRGNSQISFWDYQLEPYSGASLILGPLVIPFFLLFGESYFAIKGVPLLFSVLTLCGLFWFANRHFGLKAAVFSGLLFVFCPPSLVQLSLTAMSGRVESFFFGFLGLFFFYEYRYKRKTNLNLFLFGLLSGLGVWFYYANFILVISCLILLYLSDRKKFIRPLFIFSAAFLTGFIPWIAGNLQHHFNGTDLLQSGFSELTAERLLYTLKKPFRLLILNLPLSFGNPRVFSFCYFAVLSALLIPFLRRELGRLWKERDFSSPGLFFMIYPAVFVLLFTVSKFEIESGIGYLGYRYLTPVLIFLLLAAGIEAAVRPGKGILFAALLIMGAIGQGKALFQEPFARGLAYKGYSYSQLGARWQLNLYPYFKDYDDFRRRTEKMPESERKFLIWGIYSTSQCCGDGFTLFNVPGAKDRGLTLETLLKREGPAYRPFLYEWLGALPQSILLEHPRLKKLQQDGVPKEARRYFCRGLLSTLEHSEDFLQQPDFFKNTDVCSYRDVEMAGGLHIDYLQPEKFAELQRRISSFSDEEKSWVYRGWGYLFLSHSDISNLAVLSSYSVPQDHLKDVYWGIGWGACDVFREDRTRALEVIAGLPVSARPQAMEGFGSFEGWYEIL